MLFLYRNKEYSAGTAAEIVEQLRCDAEGYRPDGGDDSLKPFLVWSLNRLSDRIPLRELDVSEDLADETVAFNFLCLLETYDGATLVESKEASAP